MTVGKAVALFVAWFALTVVFVKVGVSIGISLGITIGLPPVYLPFIDYQPIENSTFPFAFYAWALLTNAILFASVVAAPIVIVAWKREGIYSLLGGDLTNIGRALVLLTTWVALAIVATLNFFIPHLIVAVVLQSIFDNLFGVNKYLHLLEILSTYLIVDAITLMLPLVLVVWNRRLIYDLLRVDSWFGAKSE